MKYNDFDYMQLDNALTEAIEELEQKRQEIKALKAENVELKARLEKAVELPCMVMIEQSVNENGKFINTHKAQAFNGRYGVVYIDKQKWKMPLVDICTEKSYAREAAEARLKELRGEE